MSWGCCQGFLVWPPGCGSWCCYEQTQKINLLIQQSLLARYPQPFTIPSLSLYLLLTFGEWKSQIFSLFQLSLQLRVAIDTFLVETWGNVCWPFWKHFLTSKEEEKQKHLPLAFEHDCMRKWCLDLGQPSCRYEAKEPSTKTRWWGQRKKNSGTIEPPEPPSEQLTSGLVCSGNSYSIETTIENNRHPIQRDMLVL